MSYKKIELKIWLIILFIFNISYLYSQNIDSCGIDSISVLNNHESEFLNKYFITQRDTFNFKDKKIAFITGSSGNTIGNKKDYFDAIREWKNKYNSRIHTSLIIITEEEKNKSGGYDAILIHWVKIFTDSRKSKVINRLKNGN
ncbi:MAG: hypothetical protein Kow00108_23270 [Calditrichia bacterium]